MNKLKKIIMGNKKKLLFMLMICFILSSNILAYTDVKNFNPTYGTLTARTNFRTKPSTSSSIISVLAKGTIVKMVGESNNFYIVQLSNNQVGYISKDYVKSSSTAPAGASTYTNITAKIATVSGDSVNLRRGPGTSFAKIAKLSKGTTIKIIGSIDNFYLSITADNTVGMISKDYVNISGNSTTTVTPSTSGTTGSQDEEYVLKLINEYRTKNGVPTLSMGSKLLKMARLKAEDMTQKEYFSHTSPTYGSPFDMMKNYGLSYKAAGENIAGNPSLESAVNSWINSSTHRENLLSTSYNYVGIGISKSSIYGYIVVAMFAGI